MLLIKINGYSLLHMVLQGHKLKQMNSALNLIWQYGTRWKCFIVPVYVILHFVDIE